VAFERAWQRNSWLPSHWLIQPAHLICQALTLTRPEQILGGSDCPSPPASNFRGSRGDFGTNHRPAR